MIAHSVYIVQSQIVSLGSIPFTVDCDELNPVFSPIFTSENCFMNMQNSILNFERRYLRKDRESYTHLPSKPFLRNLGRLYFDSRSIIFASKDTQDTVIDHLTQRTEHWPPYTKKDEEDEYYFQVFGHSRELKDQRMNHLYFELYRSLSLKAVFKDKTQATGKIFLHFYPSGYIIINLAIDIKQQNLQDFSTLEHAIRETRPHRHDGHWIWSCRLGEGKLPKIIKLVKENIYESLFKYPPSTLPKESHWHSALKLLTTTESKEFANIFFKGKYENFEFSHRFTTPEYLLSSTQGIIFLMSPSHKKWRQRTIQLFWRVFTIYEFLMLKKYIYGDYAKFLSSEIAELKKFRLSVSKKLTEEDLFKFSVYDPKIPEYLLALDKHIQNASPFYRRVYSSISSGINFDDSREKVKKLVEKWEAEIEQWEPKLCFLWKKIISPIRSVF